MIAKVNHSAGDSGEALCDWQITESHTKSQKPLWGKTGEMKRRGGTEKVRWGKEWGMDGMGIKLRKRQPH